METATAPGRTQALTALVLFILAQVCTVFAVIGVGSTNADSDQRTVLGGIENGGFDSYLPWLTLEGFATALSVVALIFSIIGLKRTVKRSSWWWGSLVVLILAVLRIVLFVIPVLLTVLVWGTV